MTVVEPVRGAMHLAVIASSGTRKFRVRVIGTGFGMNSENGRRWFVPDTAEGIGSAKKTFAGAKVHWFRDAAGNFDHRGESALAYYLDTDHEAGHLTDVALGADGLEASLVLHDDVPQEIVDVIAAGRVGLSIEAHAERRPAVRDGKPVVELVNFKHGPDGPASVALVTHPALRGEILRVAASRKEQSIMPDPTSAAPDLTKEREALNAALAEAQAAAKTIKVTAAKARLDGLVTAAKLPDEDAACVRAALASMAETGEIDETKVTASIDLQRKAIASREEKVKASGSSAQVTSTSRDRAILILDRMILGNQFDDRAKRVDALLAAENGGKNLAQRERDAGIPVAPFMGPRRALTLLTGIDPVDWRTGGYLGNAEQIRASVGATAMADLWADRMHKIALAYFETSDYRTNIRKMAKVISVSDFRNVDFTALGGYGNLPQVPKGADYNALSTPSSQGHEFTINKYGGTETIAWEDIVNDDMQVTQQTPRRLEDAYSRTLFEAVADKYLIANLTTDTTDYDSTAWCTTSRTPDNFGTTAFSATELAVVVKLMFQATDFSNGKRLALRPRYLLHPIDLDEAVRNALIATPAERPGITTDYSYAQSIGIEPILIPGWTNAKDHVYLADPNGPAPPQVVAFLNGQEAPTIDVQDMRNVGSWFNKDVMTMKISGVWGNDLVRHEGIFAEDVA